MPENTVPAIDHTVISRGTPGNPDYKRQWKAYCTIDGQEIPLDVKWEGDKIIVTNNSPISIPEGTEIWVENVAANKPNPAG